MLCNSLWDGKQCFGAAQVAVHNEGARWEEKNQVSSWAPPSIKPACNNTRKHNTSVSTVACAL